MLTLKDFGIRKNNGQYISLAMLLTKKLWNNSKLKKDIWIYVSVEWF
jgi:hypothetical protein